MSFLNTGQYDLTGTVTGYYYLYYNSGTSGVSYIAPTCNAKHITINGEGSRANFTLSIKNDKGTEIATMDNYSSTQRHSISNLDVSGTKYIVVSWKSGYAGISVTDMITLVD